MFTRLTTAFTTSLRTLGIMSSQDPILPPEGGIPLFLALGVNKPFGFNPWLWMYENYIQTPSAVFTGGKNGGKTATALLVLHYLLMYDVGGRRARGIYDMMRTNDGTPEDEELLQCFGDDAVRIAVKTASINPYHRDNCLTLHQQVRWTLTALHDLADHTFEPYQISILTDTISRMMANKSEEPTPLVLARIISQYTYENYVANVHSSLQIDPRLSAADSVIASISRPSIAADVDSETILKSAARIADLIRTTMVMEDGQGVFGTKSLPDELGNAYYVSQDLTDLDDMVASVYHGLSRLIIAANPDQQFDVIVQDETSKSWRSKTWAAAESDEEWQIRERAPFKIRIIQELKLYDTVGDLGSQQREQATASIRGAGIHFILRGQSKQAYKELQEILGFDDLDRAWLEGLGDGKASAGQFALKPRDGSLLKAYLPITSHRERAIISSNASLNRRLARRLLAQSKSYKETEHD